MTFAGLLRQVGPRFRQREAEMLGQRIERLAVIGRGRFGPGGDCATLQRLGRVRHDQLRIDRRLVADAAAGRAGAEGIVEGEEPRLDLRNREAGDRAGEFFREGQTARRPVFLLLVDEFDDRDALGELQRRLEALGEAGGDIGPHHDPVHHDLDVVLEFLVEHRRVGDLVEFAVHLDALEALLLPFREILAEFTLPAAHHGRHQQQPRLFRAVGARGPPSG